MKIHAYIQLQLKSNHRERVALEPHLQSPEKAIGIVSRLNYGRAPYGCVYYLDETCIEWESESVGEIIQTVILQYDEKEANRK